LSPDAGIFVSAEDGTAEIDEKYRGTNPHEGEVPDQLAHCAKVAADNCPSWAII